MNRRKLLKAAGAAVATGAVAAPAIAQSTPALRWRLTTSFPKTLDTLYGACEMFAKAVGDLSDQKFQISVYGPGEIVPAFQVFDAVANNTVEMGNSASYYYIGKDLAFAFGTAVPFGLNTRQMNAWLAYGGGLEMLNELYGTFGILGIPFGNTTAQMGGWFRKEIKTLDDMKGLKFRVGGVAGQVLSRLGVVPQQIPPGDIYPALEKGTIDAAEWIGPYDDEKLGFLKVAPYYYYPGWWEGCANGFLYINSAKWAELPKLYQNMVTMAAAQVAADLDCQIRRPQRGRHQAPGCGRCATPAVLDRHSRCVVQGDQRTVCRGFGKEPKVQGAVRFDDRIPERAVPVASGLRGHLRQLHDQADPRLTACNSGA